MTVAGKLEHLSEEEMIQELSEVKNPRVCLVHLFTGRGIYQKNNRNSVSHGVSATNPPKGGINGILNVGATSIFGCEDDPWRVSCLLTFPHEVAHSMGAPEDDEGPRERTNSTFLMVGVNLIKTPISASNLKLSELSVYFIGRYLTSNLKYEVFLNISCKFEVVFAAFDDK